MIDMTVRELVVRMQRRILSASTYAGVRTVKCPLDWWVYQEILWERRPDVVVEIGNYMGGTLLALAHQLDAIGQGRVIGVDLQHAWVAPAVRFVGSNSMCPVCVAAYRRALRAEFRSQE